MIDPRVQMTSRRRLLSLGGAGGMMSLMGMPSMAQTTQSQSRLRTYRSTMCRLG